jgi:putative capsular polysaccharide biosythesis protein
MLEFLFGKKTGVDYSGMTDFHSHILPGVDDGVGSIEESLRVLEEYERLGIRKVWLTPHVMEDVPNRPGFLRERFVELCAAYGGPVELALGSENMADALFSERLSQGDVLPTGDRGELLLVETSCFSAPEGFVRTLGRIMSAGYHPVIAHPERYMYVRDISGYRKWLDAGARFQLNLLSLGGHYGPEARAKARRLLERGYYTYAGSDLHGLRHAGLLRGLRLTKKEQTHLYKIIQK